MNPLLKAEVCPETSRTFYHRAFAKIVNDGKLLTIFTKAPS